MELLREELIVVVPLEVILLPWIIPELDFTFATYPGIRDRARIARGREYPCFLHFPSPGDLDVVVYLEEAPLESNLAIGSGEVVDGFVVVGAYHNVSGPPDNHEVIVEVLAGLCPH